MGPAGTGVTYTPKGVLARTSATSIANGAYTAVVLASLTYNEGQWVISTTRLVCKEAGRYYVLAQGYIPFTLTANARLMAPMLRL